MVQRAAIAMLMLLSPALAHADAASSAGISIPEPSDPSLFALGVVGLLVGRYAARRRPRK